MEKNACRECGKPLPLRKASQRGRKKGYCNPKCKVAYRKKLWALGRRAALAGLS